ncbi:uncharacterized protein SOCEGT47_011980 [Sorangium cellulosum]|uniref:Peptidase S1 domain-containing protein n=1 Tax=Sorangium cellulosum TaxID=56 RepID=A0A4P2PVB4_SORCE|nr:trypsin-like serine protease [Sorangium cellulosum]AUX20725.1 uncharacterized protein SOCEGT47_011980 [Sorangium cellulosum]
MSCVAAAALALAGCVAGAEGSDGGAEPEGSAAMPIQGGYADGRHDAVVGLRIFADEGRRTCSGTLIAPNLVMTAQHCVAETPRRVACATSRFGELVAPDRVYATPSVLMCERCDTPWFSVREVLRPPGGGGRVCGRDIALLVLRSPVPAERAIPFEPRLDAPPEEGERYAAVGFGLSGALRRDSGVRRYLGPLSIACVGAACGDAERIAPGEWRGETGACKGDSGGPALDAGSRVIGVGSRGRIDCERPIYTGLLPHRAWIVAVGGRAAAIGRYAPPAWVTGDLLQAAP